MNYVYRFKSKGNIVYVGRTHNLEKRFKQHSHLKDVDAIEYIECSSETDMIIKEIYYINLYSNNHTTNIKDVYDKPYEYDFNDVWKEYKMVSHKRTWRNMNSVYKFCRDSSRSIMNHSNINKDIYINRHKIQGSLSYKQICNILKQPYYKSGNQKRSQLKEFEKYFNWENKGHKYLIKKIYDVPSLGEFIIPANSVYSNHIYKILLTYLYNRLTKLNQIVEINRKQLYKELGLINQEYIDMYNKDDILMDQLRKCYDLRNKDDDLLREISIFYTHSNLKIARIVQDSLSMLQKNGYIYNKEDIIYVRGSNLKFFQPLNQSELSHERMILNEKIVDYMNNHIDNEKYDEKHLNIQYYLLDKLIKIKEES